MFVRLGFAVAAHLDAEIMLVDEVLAVGDAAFQRKCMNKIRELTVEEGRTIVFVSHNLAWVERLCDRVILVQDATIAAEGPVSQVIAGLPEAASTRFSTAGRQRSPTACRGSERARRGSAAHGCWTGTTGSRRDRCCSISRLSVEAELDVDEAIEDGDPRGRASPTVDGQRIVTALNTDGGRPTHAAGAGAPRASASSSSPSLLPGEFVIDLGVHEGMTGATVDLVERVLQFAVGVSDGEGETYARRRVRGYLRTETHWALQRDEVATRTPS